MAASRVVSCRVLLALALAPVLVAAQEPAAELPTLEGPYLGQEPPGRTPRVFADGLYAKGHTINSVFSPDGTEFYFVTDHDGNEEADLMWMRRENDRWTRPEPVPFNSPHSDNDVCISHDGDRLFWRSWRPLPGSDTPEERSYIWTVSRVGGDWGPPAPLQVGGGPLLAGYPAVTADGTLYFPHRREGNVGESDIYRAGLIDGAYGAPEHLGGVVNTPYIEGDMCVAADGRFLVVAEWHRPDNVGGGSSDLYISFRKGDGTWTRLVNLGPDINTEESENCPTLSPDGKYFFFSRYDGTNGSNWWVEAAVLEAVRPAGLE